MTRKMKDSGIEWIGEIPEEWQTVPIFTVADEVVKKNTFLSRTNALKFTYGQIVDKPNFDPVTDSYVNKTIRNYTLANKHDIVVNGLNLNFDFVTQRIGMVNKDGAITSAYICLRPKQDKINPQYLKYVLKTYDTEKAFNNMGGGVRRILNYSELGKKRVPLPQLAVQDRIVSFLKKKVSEINQTSQTIQQEIDALEEYRKSLITETATKGLDKTVPMKDSGIEWIGEIPENWKLEKLKFLGTARNGLTYSPEDLSDDGTLVLRSSNIKKGKVYDADNVYVNMFIPQNLILKENDLLICSRNGSAKLIGKNALINEKYAGSSFGAFMAVFRGKYNEYIHYVLNSNIFDYYIGSFLTSTINQLTNRNLLNLSIPFPASKTERQQIISFLKKKCSMIDFIIDKKREQISCLTQYKQSIVYEYVTGKKQVPEKEGVKNAQ